MGRYKMRGGFEGYNWIYIILALLPVIAVAIIMGVELSVKPSVPTSVSPSPSPSPLDPDLTLTITNVIPNTSIGTPTSLSVYTLPSSKSAYGNSRIMYSFMLYAVYPPDNTPEQTYNFESSQPYEYDPTGKTLQLNIPPQTDTLYSAKIEAFLIENSTNAHSSVAEYTYQFTNLKRI